MHKDRTPFINHPVPRPGTVEKMRLIHDPQQAYYIFVPNTGGKNRSVFISVHGVRRRAKDHANEFAGFAERHGVVLVAPLFPKNRFSDYQRLGKSRKSARSDLALKRILEEVAFLTNANTEELFMFGYSGGGQFVHRYAMAYPKQIKRIVVAAPGWYTFPDYKAGYPKGIGNVRGLGRVTLDPARFLSIPACVMVGGRDTRRDAEFNRSPQVDRQQGANRLERGRNWIKAMKDAARFRGMDTEFIFRILPGSNHSFLNCMKKNQMGEQVFQFLFSSPGFCFSRDGEKCYSRPN